MKTRIEGSRRIRSPDWMIAIIRVDLTDMQVTDEKEYVGIG